MSYFFLLNLNFKVFRGLQNVMHEAKWTSNEWFPLMLFSHTACLTWAPAPQNRGPLLWWRSTVKHPRQNLRTHPNLVPEAHLLSITPRSRGWHLSYLYRLDRVSSIKRPTATITVCKALALATNWNSPSVLVVGQKEFLSNQFKLSWGPRMLCSHVLYSGHLPFQNASEILAMQSAF